MTSTARKHSPQSEPAWVDANISRVVATVLAHRRLKPSELALMLPAMRRSTLYDRLGNEGAGWKASEVAEVAAALQLPVSMFYEDADGLLRSRCLSPLTLLRGGADTSHQGTLDFRPTLRSV